MDTVAGIFNTVIDDYLLESSKERILWRQISRGNFKTNFFFQITLSFNKAPIAISLEAIIVIEISSC